MRFVDEAIIEVAAGDGGNGCVSFLRERFRPWGGPDGGNGGRGGSVVLQATNRVATLSDHSYLRHFRAPRGGHGQGANKNGRAGEDKLVLVPVGTEVYDDETGELVADLTTDGEVVVVAQGGRGGKGNAHFATSTNQAPRMAQPGEEGQRSTLRLELKLLAEVGLVGLPNAGKSSLITAASAARPKVADYPFTTLTPNLGVVQLENRPPFTMADVPGLVAGAHQGAGLGLKFLKHVERTRLFLYVVDMSGEDPAGDLWTVREELLAYDAALARRGAMVAANKMDLPQSRENLAAFTQAAGELGLEVWPVSALNGQGVAELLETLADRLGQAQVEDEGEQG
ncbi:MAG: GTPase ObgE [Proteobacteria bacterium]|nr:GTPase ObgE [Pseudomonadota bacterium]MBU1452879.1 GTPase ObgE [Pseudomonadota bacterium]MBU2469771.1 GTPase ObgE [Pseudomonadota bacterium]MBU2516818.1 GTPase ObgE [Pseudomonadota bacterium]